MKDLYESILDDEDAEKEMHQNLKDPMYVCKGDTSLIDWLTVNKLYPGKSQLEKMFDPEKIFKVQFTEDYRIAKFEIVEERFTTTDSKRGQKLSVRVITSKNSKLELPIMHVYSMNNRYKNCYVFLYEATCKTKEAENWYKNIVKYLKKELGFKIGDMQRYLPLKSYQLVKEY